MDVENIYNGGGVGIADFNNDGLPDIYFTGNKVPNRLYLNKGKLKFEDVTMPAGVDGEGKWARGVSIVDINNDGWQDIYISETISADSTKRENILYINKGLDKNGVPVFKDEAKEYGLNDNSFTTQAAFFDYDNDGDLDVYMAVNQIVKTDYPNSYRPVFKNGEHPSTGRLYRNDWDSVAGHPVFTNVSKQAGILIEGYSHSVTICDINMDGWKDIYVTNDYLSNNVLYINNGDGTFSDHVRDYFKHTAYNAMGADVVDINNDGLSDVIELDMNPEDNYRKKTMLASGNYQNYLNNDYYGYQYQYVRNCLQLNLGKVNDEPFSHPVFADIGFYSGIAETDWSWTPLVADFDNDGFRDIIVTNGFPKDITDHDFVAYRNTAFALNSKEKLFKQIPVVKIPNYAFKNNGNLKFTNSTESWGIGKASFSNGAAVADLDNDGDLDVVINNINDEAFLFENQLNNTEEGHHYLKIKLQGAGLNKDAFGSWVKMYYKHGEQQVYETNPVRGYLSSNENMIWFGLGKETVVDSLVIIWPDQQKQTLTNISADQQMLVRQPESTRKFSWTSIASHPKAWFEEETDLFDLPYTHHQGDFNDFDVQRLLLHKFSQGGPPVVSGDINGDGLEDILIGGSDSTELLIFLQQKNGKFKRNHLKGNNKLPSGVYDQDIQLFDVDKDGDLDLYVSEGGFGQKAGSVLYQDKLFINDGKGNFTQDPTALPSIHSSKSCVRVADYDNDGDLDLFIGSRVEPGQYPKPVSGYILRNDSRKGHIKFTDVTDIVAPSLKNIGLICDASWSDYDNDGWPDLMIAGEWMPIQVFKNYRGKLVNETSKAGISDKKGWWNCIIPGDFDNDGNIDFIVGNLGLNSYFSFNSAFPINTYFNDFDKNGTYECMPTKFLKDKNGEYKEFTIHSRDEVVDQFPFMKKRFLFYKDFAQATFNDLFTSREKENMLKVSADYFSSCLLKNLGKGKFELIPLPSMAQFSPVQKAIVDDFNADGNLDMVLCGNDFGFEVFNGKQDAFNGLVLKGDGAGGFAPLSIAQSGIYIPGQAKSMTMIKKSNGTKMLICTQNRSALKAFSLNPKQ